MKSSAAQLAALEPYKWQPGESANPAGRPKGSRHKLQEAVVKALYTDFIEHGPAAIVKVREKKPEVYLMACVALLPKQAQKIESPFQDVSDRELDMLEQHLAAIRAKLVKDIEASEPHKPIEQGQSASSTDSSVTAEQARKASSIARPQPYVGPLDSAAATVIDATVKD